ncbi:FecR family protein [Bacteroides fragilis]
MKIDDAIIDKVLNNGASVEEAGLVAEWFATEEGSEFLSGRLESESARLIEERAREWLDHPVPEERMWERFIGQIKPEKKIVSYRRGLIATAVLIPFLFLSISLWFLADRTGVFSATEYAELKVPCGEQVQVVLQDGTVIQLNSDTRLRYPRKFGLFSRSVELWEEGFFVVAKDKKRPFIVDLKGVEVKVTGTKFNVKAYPSEPNVWVTLEEGGVLLKDIKNKEYPLVPGESAEYNRTSGICQITKPDDMSQISSWRSNSLNFYLTPLRDIIKVMERQYDVHFVVRDSILLNNRFTLSTSKVNVDDVLRDLEAVSSITLPMGRKYLPSVMNLVWGLGWSGLPIVCLIQF